MLLDPISLVGKLEVANEKLLTLSTVDPLTDLLNHRAFTSESERFFDLQRRSCHGSNESSRQATEVLAQWRNMAMPSEDSPSGDFLSCSIGICEGLAADFDSLENMILAADQALFRAKHLGRDTFVVFLS